MIEEEKWAAPSMTYFRPHFMVSAITNTNTNVTNTIVTNTIFIIIIIRCLPLAMAMQEHTILRQL